MAEVKSVQNYYHKMCLVYFIFKYFYSKMEEIMKIDELIVCPKCNSKNLKVKREATYLYTYTLNQSDTQASAEASRKGKVATKPYGTQTSQELSSMGKAATHDQPYGTQASHELSGMDKATTHDQQPYNTHTSEEAFLPFLFDYREQLDNYEYVECEDCHNRFACNISDPNSKIKLTILQKAIRSDYENNPGYLG